VLERPDVISNDSEKSSARCFISQSITEDFSLSFEMTSFFVFSTPVAEPSDGSGKTKECHAELVSPKESFGQHPIR
jgi:hypothetical protein